MRMGRARIRAVAEQLRPDDADAQIETGVLAGWQRRAGGVDGLVETPSQPFCITAPDPLHDESRMQGNDGFGHRTECVVHDAQLG